MMDYEKTASLKYCIRFILVFAMTVLLMCVFTGCGNKNKIGNRNTSTQSFLPTGEVSTEDIIATASTTDVSTEEADTIFVQNPDDTNVKEYEEPIGEADTEVDVDLTVLTPNMVYAEVYNMMFSPEDYLGKTIKLQGPYYPLYYEETGQYYHYILITDAMACCQNGMEFIWDEGSHKYPDEYPDKNQEVMIVGTFSSYQEFDYIYYYLDVDNITIVE